MKVIIIEDEVTLAAGLESMLKKLNPGIEVAAIIPDVSSACDAVRKNPDTDIVFADIRLQDGYSFDVFDTVETDAMIVFVTAYDQYALKAFDYDCIDYILKPYEICDLARALEKYTKRSPSTHIADSRRISRNGFGSEILFRRRLKILRLDSALIIDVNEICYAEYDLGNVIVHCRDGFRGMADMSLTKLSSELDPRCFMKVSRTHIVNLSQVGMIKPTLRRKKEIALLKPYDDVRIEVTPSVLKQLKIRLEI